MELLESRARLVHSSGRGIRCVLKRIIGVLVISTLSLYGGISTGFSLYFRLAYILLGALAFGYVWAWLGLRWLEVQVRRRTTHAELGGPIEGRLQVENHGPLPKAWLEVEELSNIPGYHSGNVISLTGRGHRAWFTKAKALQRGAFTLGPVRVTSSDPLGIVRLKRHFGETSSIIVFPEVQPLPYLAMPTASLPGDGPMRHRTLQTTPIMSSVREYSPGDAVSRVHWPSTARMGRLMVKEFDLGLASDLWVVADFQEGVHAGTFPDNTEEAVVMTAASIAYKYLAAGIPVSLAARGKKPHFVPADRGDAQIKRIMEELALARADGSTTVERVLYQLEPSLSRYHSVVVVTPSGGPSWAPLLGYLRNRGVRIVAILVDAASFGGEHTPQSPLLQLMQHGVPHYVLRKGQALAEALHTPADGHAPVAAAGR